MIMDGETEEHLILAAAAVLLRAMQKKRKMRKAPREQNTERNRVRKAEIIFQDYFHSEENDLPISRIRQGRVENVPVFGCLSTNQDFERVNRMPRQVFERILQACRQRDFFRQTADATGLLGCSTEQKFIAALRQITLGTSAFSQAEYCGVSETTAWIALDELCASTLDTFQAEYLRMPSRAEQLQIEKSFKKLGFPGCIGAVDCSSWEWKNCPTAWHGEYKGREKRAVVKIEAWADADLRIWSFYFGCSGSHNDLNILHTSPLFTSILSGAFNITSSLSVSGFPIENFYFLADGIYPHWGIFALTIPENKRNTEEDRVYAARQEGARKCVERLFGVLFARFHILASPARMWSTAKMLRIANVCAILHNMIVEDRTKQNHSESSESVMCVESSELVLEGYDSLRRLRESFDMAECFKPPSAVASAAMCSKLRFSQLQSALKAHIAQTIQNEQ